MYLLLMMGLLAQPNPVDTTSAYGGVPAADLDLDGTYKLITDADGDSYLWSSSDDVFQFVIGGVTRLSAQVGGLTFLTGGMAINWAGESTISSPVDGNILMTNDGATDFGLLQFGGTTSAFPAIKRSTTQLQFRLADDSGTASISVGNVFGSGRIEAAGTNFIGMSSRSRWYAPGGDGVLSATDNDGTTPANLTFGTAIQTPLAVTTLAAGDTIPHTHGKVIIKGTGAGTTVATSTPTIAAGTEGECIVLYGDSATDLYQLLDNATLSGSNVFLNSGVNFTMGAKDNIKLCYVGAAWIQEGGRVDIP